MWFWDELSIAEQVEVGRWVTDRYPEAAETMSIQSERELWAEFHADWSCDQGPGYSKDTWKAREHVLLARIRPPGSRRAPL